MTTLLWMTVTQVAAESGRNRYSIYDALRRGLLQGTQSHAQACWRVRRDWFEDWMERGAPLDLPRRERLRRRRVGGRRGGESG